MYLWRTRESESVTVSCCSCSREVDAQTCASGERFRRADVEQRKGASAWAITVSDNCGSAIDERVACRNPSPGFEKSEEKEFVEKMLEL